MMIKMNTENDQTLNEVRETIEYARKSGTWRNISQSDKNVK